jgi:dTDP-glucose 4,6-dehydratase
MILNATEGLPLPIYGDGLQIRDWLYVEDHCEAIHFVLQQGRLGQTYNIGGDNQPTNLELVRHLCSILDEHIPQSPHVPHEGLISFVTDRPGHDRRYAMDIRKIQSELDWHPGEDLLSGLSKTVLWYLENIDWVNSIRAGSEYSEWVELNYKRRGGIN